MDDDNGEKEKEDEEQGEEQRKLPGVVGESNETAANERGEKSGATRLTTFQSLRYSAVDTFRSSRRGCARERKRERGRESTLSLVFLLLLRENEIDPLLIVDLKKIEILVSVYPAIFLYSARFPASASSTTLTRFI